MRCGRFRAVFLVCLCALGIGGLYFCGKSMLSEEGVSKEKNALGGSGSSEVFFVEEAEAIISENESHGGEPLASRVEWRPLMGTRFGIRYYIPDGMSESDALSAVEEAFAMARELEGRASSFDAESELSRLNRAPADEAVSLSDELFSLLDQALDLARATDGFYDPCMGAATRAWRRTQSRGALPDEVERHAVLAKIGFNHIRLDREKKTLTKLTDGVLLDLGGIAKGAALDIMAELLKKRGIHRFLLSTTSDIRAGDPPPGREAWQVRTIADANINIALCNEALSTSGTHRQAVILDGKSYAHLIDKRTGLGTMHRGSCAVRARSSAVADACATACFFLNATDTANRKRLEDSLDIQVLGSPAIDLEEGSK